MRSHTKSSKRNERHSAVWGGKPVALLLLLLIASPLVAQSRRISVIQDEGGNSGMSAKFAPDLAEMLKSNGTAKRRVIVTYKQAPNATSASCELLRVYGRDEAHEVIRRSQQDYLDRFAAVLGPVLAQVER